jgi:hypothetical protein
MWQLPIIALLVLAAAGYVTWTFLSLSARQRLLDALAARGWWVNRARAHRSRLATPGCSNCSAAADHAVTARQKS